MTTEPGPEIECLTRRLSETPPEFLGPPAARAGKREGEGAGGRVFVAAVVSDLLRDLGGDLLTAARARPFIASDESGRRRLSLVLVAAWLLADRWFRDANRFAPAAYELLSTGLDDLAAIVEPARFTSDADRREELARVCLRALGLRPQGETEAQSADRLATLDSAERIHVLRDTRRAQERVREVREAMRKKAAEEAAAAYGRE